MSSVSVECHLHEISNQPQQLHPALSTALDKHVTRQCFYLDAHISQQMGKVLDSRVHTLLVHPFNWQSTRNEHFPDLVECITKNGNGAKGPSQNG